MPAPNPDAVFFAHARKHILPIRMSQYDIADRCNLKCEGCLFFANGTIEQHKPDNKTLAEEFFKSERDRGVNYAFIGGAEPALEISRVRAAAQFVPRGVIFTNGVKVIPRDIRYRIHISLWGLPAESALLRGADVVQKQLNNYRNDDRAIFVFTITHKNLDSLRPIAQLCEKNAVRLTFNHFSPPTSYNGKLQGPEKRDPYFRFSSQADNLLLTAADLQRSHDTIDALSREFSETILYDDALSNFVHNPNGLYKLDDHGIAQNCVSRVKGVVRHYTSALQEDVEAKCCCPNIDCASCRLYPQAFSALLQRPKKNYAAGDWTKLLRLWCKLFLLPEQYDIRIIF